MSGTAQFLSSVGFNLILPQFVAFFLLSDPDNALQWLATFKYAEFVFVIGWTFNNHNILHV